MEFNTYFTIYLQILLLLIGLANASKHGDLQDIINDRNNLDNYINRRESSLNGHHRHRRQQASKNAELPRRLFLEVGVTMDKRAVEAVSRTTDPEKYVLDVMEIVDQRSALLNISVVVNWIELWDKKDVMLIEETQVSNLLKKWMKRRSMTVQNHWTDVSVLITGYNFAAVGDPVNGLAAQSSTCLKEAGVVVLYKEQSITRLAQTILHELSHSLGMDHDNNTCCPDGINKCAMGITLNDYQVANPKFSQCSLDYLAAFLQTDQSQCLDNTPSEYPIKTAQSLCGNGILDPEEECDCGGGCLYGCCNCCKKCKLVGRAKCSSGPCCDTSSCQFRPSTFVCRNDTVDSCNPPDYCLGNTNECPEVKAADGIKCSDKNNVKSICLKGRCMTRATQCQKYWDKNYSEATEKCYIAGITMVGRFAHCGQISETSYVRCLPSGESKFYKCGMLQCTGPDENLEKTTSFHQKPQKNSYITDTKCLTLSHGPWEDREGSVMVEDGTNCGENRLCYSGNCLSSDVVVPNILNKTATYENTTFANVIGSTCGNGVVESDEDCDCGSKQCDCCEIDTCQFRKIGQGCYSNDCLACNGTSAQCSGRHLPLMTSCNDGGGQCYNGKCSSLDLQCKKYYGEFAIPVAELYPLNAKDNTSQHNGGGYILLNRKTQAWHNFTEFQVADNDGTCGLLYCKAFVPANVTDERGRVLNSRTYSVQGVNSHRVTYFSFETTRDGEDLFDKFYPLLTDNGTPCIKEGKSGYCVRTSLQMDRIRWNWYWTTKCIVPQSQ